jgi:tetratricopeptide (TPR) repeat protein
MQIRQATRECEKLLKSDAQAAYLHLALVAQACGDLDDAEANLAKAERLGHSADVAGHKIIAYGNLGYFSRAYAELEHVLAPGDFSRFSYLAVSKIAVQCVMKFYRQSVDAHIEVSSEFPLALMQEAEEFMVRTRFNDSDIMALTDLAGRVMREHGLMFVGDAPQLAVRSGKDGDLMHITYLLGTDVSEVAQANLELAQLVGESGVDVPESLLVSFAVAA